MKDTLTTAREQILAGMQVDEDLGAAVLDALVAGADGPLVDLLARRPLAAPDAADIAAAIHAVRDASIAVLDEQPGREELARAADELLLRALKARSARVSATLRREALEARGVSELLDQVPYTRDADGALTFVASTVESLVGISAEELLAAPGRFEERIEPEDRPAYDAEAARRVEQRTAGSVAYRLRHADGSRVVAVVDRAVIVPGEDAPHIAGVLTDVTLRNARDAAAARDERMLLLGTMAGGLAHSYNNILTVISGYSSAFEDVEGLGDLERRAIAKIAAAADRATEMTHRLILYTVGEEPAVRPVNLLRVLKESRDLIRGLVSRAVDLKVVAEPDLPPVLGDTGRLVEALLHLVSNAREAMPRGGTLVLAAYRSKEDPAGHVILEVRDTGSGIPEDVLPRVFDPFFSTRDRDDAAGLGCAQVREIVADHGGTVSIESVPGEGTRVVIRLPAAGT